MTKRKRYIDDLRAEGGYTAEQVALLKRVFQGMEIIDAKAKVYITAIAEDFENAIPNDLENCVFANSCKRLFGSGAMVFMKQTAYVDLEDEDGIRKVHRFILGLKMQDAIRLLDESKGKEFKPGVYILSAPSPSHRLDAQLVSSRRYRKKPDYAKRQRIRQRKRRAAIKSKARIVKTKNRAGLLGIIRSGTGLVHTTIVQN